MLTRFDIGISLYDKFNPNSPLYWQQWFWQNSRFMKIDRNEYANQDASLIMDIDRISADGLAIMRAMHDFINQFILPLQLHFFIKGILKLVAYLVILCFVVVYGLLDMPYNWVLGIVQSVYVTTPRIIINALFMRSADIRFLPNPYGKTPPLGYSDAPLDYSMYKVREALRFVFTLPFALLDTMLTFLAFPIKSIKAAWTFMTEIKEERETRKVKDLAVLLSHHHGLQRVDQPCEGLNEFLARLSPQVRSEELHQYYFRDSVKEKICDLTQDFNEDQYLNVVRALQYTGPNNRRNGIVGDLNVKFGFAQKAIPAETLVKFIKEEELSLVGSNFGHQLLSKLDREQLINLFTHEDLMFKTLAITPDKESIKMMMDLTGEKTVKSHIQARAPLMNAISLCGYSVPGLELPKPFDVLNQNNSIERNGVSVHPLCLMIFQGQLVPSQVFKNLEERKKYFNREDKPLAKALLEAMRNRSMSYEANDSYSLIPWLEDCTPAEIQGFLDLRNPAGENLLIVEALENNHTEWIPPLRNCGIEVPQRLREDQANRRGGGVAGAQGIHDGSIHYTVTVSLVQVDSWLKSNQDKTGQALAEFRAFVMNDRHPREIIADQKMQGLTRASPVVKRCFERLYKLRNNSESGSKVSIEKMFIFFWTRWKRMPTRNSEEVIAKKAAWDVFCTQLFAIQRGDAQDEASEDSPICSGGTYNQITMALQAVAPDVVWVDLMNEKLFMIKGMILLRDTYLKKAIDKLKREDYQQALRERLRSEEPTAFFPKLLVKELKGDKDFCDALRDICLNKTLQRQSVENPQDFVDMFLRNLEAHQSHEVEIPAYATRELNEVLTQIREVFDSHIQAPTYAPLSFAYRALSPSAAPEIDLVVHQKEEKDLLSFSQNFQKMNPIALPKVFCDLADDHRFMVQLYNLVKEDPSKQRYLLDTFNDNQAAKSWLNNPEVFGNTLKALDLPSQYEDLEEFLHATSVALFSALFRAYFEKRSIRCERGGVAFDQTFEVTGNWFGL